MPDREQDQLLEIYKLHAELADRVSQRREGANRLFVGLHVGLVLVQISIVSCISERPTNATLTAK